jgi:hypothetical protein
MSLSRPFALLLLLLAGVASAQQSSDTGTVTLTARVSGYVDVASGGAATLTGDLGGAITSNTAKGAELAGVTINLGDVSPANTNAFVRATVPLRLRSNVPFRLSVTTAGFTNSDPLALQPADVGFGIANLRRSDPGVNNGTGLDTILNGAGGDPSLDPDANTGTPRWEYAAGKSLADFATKRDVLSGARIMNVVSALAQPSGLLVDTFFVVRPQFFTPGTFTTTVTYTIATP